MRKRTLSDLFLALTIGGCMAVLSPQQDQLVDQQADASAVGAPQATAIAPPASATSCPEAPGKVDLPNPVTIAGEAASALEMPFFSFGSAHLE
jgi:hypothetical protein